MAKDRANAGGGPRHGADTPVAKPAHAAKPAPAPSHPANSRGQSSPPPRLSAQAPHGLTTAEALLQGMRGVGVSVLSTGSFPLHLLIVESDPSLLQILSDIGSKMGFTVHAYGPASAAGALAGLQCDVAILDLTPETIRLELLRAVHQRFPRVPVLVTTAFASVQVAVDALRQGASDFLTKPFSLEELTGTLHVLAERRSFDADMRRTQHQIRTSPALQEVAAASPGMQKLLSMVTRVALSRHPVTILGETGSGKERIARMLHNAAVPAAPPAAPAEQRPFLQVACNIGTASAVEQELFGSVEPGNAAPQEPAGLLAQRGGGTLFLNEIDGLSLETQAKLQRCLQTGEVRPAPGTPARPVTVRIIASSSRDLLALTQRGAFRRDLYDRLNIVTLRVPPLRQRREDIPLLAASFLERESRSRQLSYTIDPDAMRLLLRHDWPGNVRELESAIERACTVSSGPVLHAVDFPTQLHHVEAESDAVRIDHRVRAASTAHAPAAHPAVAAPEGVTLSLAEMERLAILKALSELNGDKLMAAKILGIGKTTLYRKLKEYGVAELFT